MKKGILTLIAGCISLLSFAQEDFKFKIEIKPSTTYTTHMETSMDGTIDIIADEAMLEQMQANGMKTPMKMQQESIITLISKTENRKADGSISATMSYNTEKSITIVNDTPINQPNIMDGMEIKGSFNTDNIFEIDSIFGDNLSEQIRSTLTQTMENIQKQIQFPAESLKIGDTFTNEIPMSIPMQGMNPIDIVVNTTYQLTKVADGKAYLNLDQTITLNTSQEELKLDASGSGNGTCEYSINDNYLVKYNATLPINLSMEMNEMIGMKMLMDTKTSMSVTIE